MEEGSDRNLIINYLPSALSDIEFRRLFEPYGPIVSSKIVRDNRGRSLCYGFVKYAYVQDAMDAIDNLNGLKIYNKMLKVGCAMPQVPHSERANNLLITNLPKSITSEELELLFNPFGKILFSRILYEPTMYFSNTNESDSPRLSKGKAFVRFERLADATQALEALNNSIPEGYTQPLEIKMTKKLSKILQNSTYSSTEQGKIDQNYINSETSNNTELSNIPFIAPNIGYPNQHLIIRNLSPKINEFTLFELLKPCGNPIWIKIARHPCGKSRQYGYIQMQTPEYAANVIQHLHGCLFLGHKLFVNYNNNLDSLPFSLHCDNISKGFNIYQHSSILY